MANIDDVFSGVFLKAADLKGAEPTVTIESAVEWEKDGSKKIDIGFVGKEKHLLANKTNCGRIAFMFGKETDGWIGKKIQLYTDLVDYQGKTVEAIRVRPVKAAEPARKAAPVDEFADSTDDTF